MKIFSKPFLLGLLLLLLAVADWKLAEYRGDAEQGRQKRLGQSHLDLGVAGDWVERSFSPTRRGLHSVFLESVYPLGKKSPEIFDGQMEVEIKDSAGKTLFEKKLTQETVSHRFPSPSSSTFAGNLQVESFDSNEWKLRVKISQMDPKFTGLHSSVYVQTPALFDTRSYRMKKRVESEGLAGIGIVFLLLHGGGRRQARSRSVRRKPG